MFLGIVTYLVEIEKTRMDKQVPREYVLVAVLGGLMISSVTRRIITGKRFLHIRDMESTQEKLRQFRSVLITNFALIEVPVLLTTGAYFLTADKVFLILTPVLLLQLFLLKIDAETIKEKLNLQDTDMQGLQ